MPVLARAVVGSGVGISGAGCSNMAGVVCPAEAGAEYVWTSGTAGHFPLSMPALVSPAPASSAVPAALAGAPESEISC
jgi:hypothetical protein